MNVLFITHYSKLYGANKSLLDVIDEIKNYEVTPYVILPKNGELAEELEKRKVEYKIHYYGFWTKKINKHQNVKSIIKLILNCITSFLVVLDIKKWKIDIVHSNSSCTEVGILASIRAKVPHVWHFRELLEEDYNMKFIYPKEFVIKLMKKSDRIIAISKCVKEKYDKYFENEKLLLIYNGVLVSAFQGKNLNNDKFVILLVGLISENKGTEEAINAVKNVILRGYNNIELWIAGTGGAYEEKLKRYVAKENISSNIVFLGYRTDIIELRSKANISLVCSKMEAFGRVTVESMLAKTLVIGANKGGTSEIIENMKTGILYESGNYIDLADKIVYCITNRNEVDIMAERAYNESMKKYTITKNVENILKTYRDVLDTKKT